MLALLWDIFVFAICVMAASGVVNYLKCSNLWMIPVAIIMFMLSGLVWVFAKWALILLAVACVASFLLAAVTSKKSSS